MPTKEQIKEQSADLVKQEIIMWQDSTAWITDKVAFNVREVIKKARKNYWGVFDKPIDPQTGREKVFIPMTEFVCESTVKNIDIDTKDVILKSQKPGRNRLSIFLSKFVKNKLDKMDFGMMLDDMERSLAIDGTVVWKIQKNPVTENPIIEKVDLLNFYIDPTASSIKDTNAVIERVLLTKREVDGMDGWLDKDLIQFAEDKPREDNNPSYTTSTRGKTKFAEIFVREGLVPKSLITGVYEDEDKEVLARIVTSKNEGSYTTHKIKEIKKKSYREFWLTRVPGRWHGRGQAEKVMMLQAYQNMIVNIRITRATVSQLGLWKVKRNSGITPQMLGRLATNGAIKVRNMDDIEQMVMQEASVASYRDEDVAQNWAERVTSAFEAVTGESLPASQTATTTSIQSRSAQSNFVLIREGVGIALEDIIENHLLPMVTKDLKKEDVVRISLDGEDLREFDNQVAEVIAAKKNPDDFDAEKQRVIEKLQSGGNDRYIQVMDDVDLTEYDVEVVVGNEKIDKAVVVTDLINLLGIAPQYAPQIVPQVLDTLGINIKLPAQNAQAGQGQIQSPRGAQSPEDLTTRANTLGPAQAV